MLPPLELDAVILDLDGLMIDSEPIYRSAWQSAAADLGYELTDALYLTLIGLSDRDSEEVLIRVSALNSLSLNSGVCGRSGGGARWNLPACRSSRAFGNSLRRSKGVDYQQPWQHPATPDRPK